MFTLTAIGAALCAYLGLTGASCTADAAKAAGQFSAIFECAANNGGVPCQTPASCLQFAFDPASPDMTRQYLCYGDPADSKLPTNDVLLTVKPLI